MKYLIILLSGIGFGLYAPNQDSYTSDKITALEAACHQIECDAGAFCLGLDDYKNKSHWHGCMNIPPINSMTRPNLVNQQPQHVYRLGKDPLNLCIFKPTSHDIILILTRFYEHFGFHVYLKNALAESNQVICRFVQFLKLHNAEPNLVYIILEQFKFEGQKCILLPSLERDDIPFLNYFKIGMNIGNDKSPLCAILLMYGVWKYNEPNEYGLCSLHDKYGRPINKDDIPDNLVVVHILDLLVFRLKIATETETPEYFTQPYTSYNELLNLSAKAFFEEVEVGVKISENGNYTGSKWMPCLACGDDYNTDSSLYELMLYMCKPFTLSVEGIVQEMVSSGIIKAPYLSRGLVAASFQYPSENIGLTDVHVDMPRVSLAEPEGEAMPIGMTNIVDVVEVGTEALDK